MNNVNNNMLMQNQFMNFNESKIDKIIKPFQDKITMLQEEIRQKDLIIARLNYKLEQYNINNPNQQSFNNNQMNNPMNQMNQFNQMNNPMNQMNQFNQMDNQMNQFNQMDNLMNQMLYVGQNNVNNEVKHLELTFNIVGDKNLYIKVQCNSNETMESAIDKFICKSMYEKKSYKFFLRKKIFNNLSIEQNGINDDKNNIILVEKIKENNQNNSNLDNSSQNNRINDNINQKKNNFNSEQLGEPINLCFVSNKRKINVILGIYNTVNDALNKYFEIAKISNNNHNIHFLLDGQVILLEDKRNIGEVFHNCCTITVIDESDITGA